LDYLIVLVHRLAEAQAGAKGCLQQQQQQQEGVVLDSGPT
jgi:hypothetical protein